ncbi:MAG: hypothetical protein ACI83D_000172 [Planctomycetota bacterium]|jgi:hypothetical protein
MNRIIIILFLCFCASTTNAQKDTVDISYPIFLGDNVLNTQDSLCFSYIILQGSDTLNAQSKLLYDALKRIDTFVVARKQPDSHLVVMPLLDKMYYQGYFIVFLSHLESVNGYEGISYSLGVCLCHRIDGIRYKICMDGVQLDTR